MSSTSICRIARTRNIVYCEDISWRTRVFQNRFDAGVFLARLVKELELVDEKTVVYGLVAGGVPVAYSLVCELGVPLDIVVVKKITFPWTTEAGFGAVTVDGEYVYDGYVAHHYLGYSRETVDKLASRVYKYVLERTKKLRGSIDYPRLDGYRVLVVDDGIATGYTMVACLKFLKRHGVGELVVVSPTGSSDGVDFVSSEADRVAVANIRNPPYAVADAYMEWHDVSDEEVLELLEKAREKGLYPPRNTVS